MYIYLSPGFDRHENALETRAGNCRFRAIGLDFRDKAKVVEVVQELVADGAQLVELRGGFGPIWIAKVSEAIGSTVPVGSVAYGPEARSPMLEILS